MSDMVDTGCSSDSPIRLNIDEAHIGATTYGAQVSDIAWKMYQDLKDECEAIFTAVKALSKKQKGQGGAGDEEINENVE
ncbi:hypothetical protein K435DRAFT_864311 [Dendrothele bispora CBS 962.96]|uniref:Uncharacterized protein n=1 Tax=Dendrothele bispora (strain CBS 962.96) TaxID=1314807 RepID=A0A4S8LN05_DENBC|nr:hypothetical protein K435DRAFT_864311 [Dendrothele bispora CBS 962.96]